VIALKRAGLNTATVLSRALDVRDHYTAHHDESVSALARRIGQELWLAEAQIDAIGVIGILHDIGKLAVPTEILIKPVKLDEHELAIVRQHPACGAEILRDVEFPWPVAAGVRQHHERLDGSGYPDGLKGGQILLEAQVVSVADIIDAMGSHRPYRPALGLSAARDELMAMRRTQLNADVVDAGLTILASGEFYYPA